MSDSLSGEEDEEVEITFTMRRPFVHRQKGDLRGALITYFAMAAIEGEIDPDTEVVAAGVDAASGNLVADQDLLAEIAHVIQTEPARFRNAMKGLEGLANKFNDTTG